MSAAILRPRAVFGPGNPLPVQQTKFYEDYVMHDEADPYVPGTNIQRLRPVRLGARAVGFFSDEVFALNEALRQLRDTTPGWKPPPPKPRTAAAHHTKRRAKRKAA
jgi:hypothetical protein